MEIDEKPFAVERAKTGRAKCKMCKCPIDKNNVRIAKLMSNPFGDGKMKCWYHVTCIFETFAKQRATTKKIDDPEADISGWDILTNEDKEIVLDKLREFEDSACYKNSSPMLRKQKEENKCSKDRGKSKDTNTNSIVQKDTTAILKKNLPTKDDMFYEFQQLCAKVASTSAYTTKTEIIKKMFTKGSEGDAFKGDITLWCSLLLPGIGNRVYNLRSKQLIKLMSRIFHENEEQMLEHLEQGDVAETISVFFEQNSAVRPNIKSVLTIHEVEQFLEELSTLTRENDQIQHFCSIVKRCTANDLKMIIRLISHDLRINAGPKHILKAVHDDAYAAFQISKDLPSIITRCFKNNQNEQSTSGLLKSPNNVSVITLMTPVLPMLAETCKSVEMAMKKCPEGMLSEIKYDGERIQIHKEGTEFRYFSRSLKPVMKHKVELLENYIALAFPSGNHLILDGEILLIDTHTGRPLPFGSLGKHKKEKFKEANVCLFVFDCMYYNGESLLNKSVRERRKILEDNITVIPNRIMLSEIKEIRNSQSLRVMITDVLKLGLEGLVLKDFNSIYEPGKRHWLKIKKDYLLDGMMADSADLVVLGAWYGTGQKGGMKSVFLMGCYDDEHDIWVTVTKVHTGHDDATLKKLQNKFDDMIKIGKNPNLVPKWLRINKLMIPDFVAKDPKVQPIWEITGAEFTNQGVHTADNISIRFPRVTRIRDDKTWETATNLSELRQLFQRSSESIDFSLLLNSNNINSLSSSSQNVNRKDRKRKSHESNSAELEVKQLKKKKKNDNVTETYERSKHVTTEFDTNQNDDGKISDTDSNNSHLRCMKDQRKYYSFLETDVSTSVLNNVYVALAKDVKKYKHPAIRSILRKFGAIVLEDCNLSKATHVIHSETRLPSTVLNENTDIPKTAFHVNESWIEAVITKCKMQNAKHFAVSLISSYCNCPCDHN